MERYREIKRIEIEDKYLYMDSGTSDGTQIKYHKGDVWYKVDNKKSVKENIKNTFSKSFSPSYELNYNYLKEYCDLEIDMDRLRNELDKEPESYQRDFLMYQVGIN